MHYNERELLLMAAEGNEDAFESLYRHYHDKSFSIILSYIKSYADAEDLLQDIFMKLWAGRENLGHVEKFDAYLFITVRHALSHAMQQTERQQRIRMVPRLEDIGAVTAEEGYHRHDIPALLTIALDQLPGQQRRIYKLSREEGLTHEQIAAMMELSPKTISNTITLVLNHIRGFLRRHDYIFNVCWFIAAWFSFF